jgi:hypothetical protein
MRRAGSSRSSEVTPCASVSPLSPSWPGVFRPAWRAFVGWSARTPGGHGLTGSSGRQPGEAITLCNDAYWVDDNAAEPVLLVDEATEAITEALHRLRCGSVLNDRDLAAAGIALSDLFGGLSQLVDSLTHSLCPYAEPDPLHVRRLEDQLATLRARTLSAQQAAEELRLRRATIHPTAATG